MTFPAGLIPSSSPLSPSTMTALSNQWFDALKTSWIGPLEPPALLIADGMIWLDTGNAASPRLKLRVSGAWTFLQSSVGPIIADCDDAIYDGASRIDTTTLNSPWYGTAGSMLTTARANACTQLAFRQNSTETDLIAVRSSLNAAGTSWTEWRRVFSQADIVGVCGFSLGVPSGAVIESGINSNGGYLRLADGSQICWHSKVIAFDSTSRLGGTWAFSKPFVSSPRLSFGLSTVTMAPNVSQLAQIWIDPATLSATLADIYLYRIQGQTNFGTGDTASVHIHATGRYA